MTMGVYIMEMPTFNTLATSYCSEESTKTYVVMRESGAFWPIRVQLGGESLKKQKWEYTITNGITGVIIWWSGTLVSPQPERGDHHWHNIGDLCIACLFPGLVPHIIFQGTD